METEIRVCSPGLLDKVTSLDMEEKGTSQMKGIHKWQFEAWFRRAFARVANRFPFASKELPDSPELVRFALETSRIGSWDLDLVDRTFTRSLEHDRIFG